MMSDNNSDHDVLYNDSDNDVNKRVKEETSGESSEYYRASNDSISDGKSESDDDGSSKWWLRWW